jgi:hypothetical protein
MHGGRIYIRTNAVLEDLPSQVIAEEATKEELQEISAYTAEFANDRFLLLKPNAKNPYKQLYTEN